MFLQLVGFIVMLFISGFLTFMSITFAWGISYFGGQTSDKVFIFVLIIVTCAAWFATIHFSPLSVAIK